MPNETSQKVGGTFAPIHRSDTCDVLSDEAVAKCLAWLKWHAEHDALTRRWQEIESRLIHEHNWFRLSEAEREVMPEAAEMKGIEDRLNSMFERKMRLLCDLPSATATTAQGVMLKLSVATASVYPDENEEAHNLLRSTLGDLCTITGLPMDVSDPEYDTMNSG